MSRCPRPAEHTKHVLLALIQVGFHSAQAPCWAKAHPRCGLLAANDQRGAGLHILKRTVVVAAADLAIDIIAIDHWLSGRPALPLLAPLVHVAVHIKQPPVVGL